MARRPITVDADIELAKRLTPSRVGLAVVDTQTLHRGHLIMLTEMTSTVGTAIVGLGSVKKHGIHGHPFTFSQRRTQIEMVLPRHFSFVPLDDIEATVDNDEWPDYVLSKIKEVGLPDPTDYFSGSDIDAKWYEGRFATLGEPSFVTPLTKVYGGEKRIHIIDRDDSGVPSGREIRFLIERRDESWKNYVPSKLHAYIDWTYPPHLRQAVRGTEPPPSDRYPVGTRFVFEGGDPKEILELKDNLKWRRVSDGPDEKTKYAAERHRET